MLACLFAQTAWADTNKVNLQLKWHHQFQFAGYYAAQAKGFYKDAGLDVNIIEGGPGKPALDAVLNGTVQYGISDADLLLAHMHGKPIVAMAAIFQHSPFIIVSREDSNIRRLADLMGKSVMMKHDLSAVQFDAMMLKAGLDPANVHFVTHTGQLDDLINGKVDAIAAYSTNEPYRLRARGVEPAIISTTDYDVDFYGDTLFTSRSEVDSHPDRADAFLKATLKGWRYAFDNPEEIADLILRLPGVKQSGATRDSLLAEAKSMRPLVMPDIVDMGHMNTERWSHIAQLLTRLKLAPDNYQPRKFIYHYSTTPNSLNTRWIAFGIAALLLCVMLVILWNVQMRRQVRMRTEALHAEIARREQTEAYLKISSRMARVGSWVLSLPEKNIYWSEEVLDIHECPPDFVPTMESALAFYPEEWRSRIVQALEECIQHGASFDEELPILTCKDKLLWVRIIGQSVVDQHGNITRLEGAIQDISAQKVAESRIQHLAFYDSLTSLPNRQLFIDRLEHTLAYSARTSKSGAVLFIDLDNFKTLNDTMGHDLGDMLLQQVAMRIAGCLRESDTVARFGGDEFVVLLHELSGNHQEAAAQARLVSEKILISFAHPFQFSGYEHHTSASIGVTLFDQQPTTVDEILKRADLAMYQSKAAGRNVIRFFDPEMQALIADRVEMEEDLRNGLRNDEFFLCYQPQVDNQGRLLGAEALLRWRNPRRGMIPPSTFIPLAEDSGLIVSVGNWVMYAACKQLVNWAQQPLTSKLTLAVNVSAKQLRQMDFVDQIVEVLNVTGANPKRLKLELTESLMVNNIEDVIAKMTELKNLGVGFSIDDFGIGYSSLSYLKLLPLDQLKIDQSFVRDVLTDPNDAVIARTIIALGKSLNLQVIAEGVETLSQREFLDNYGCDAYQGYLFSKPVPADEFERDVVQTFEHF
ncbi:EAL domain-containing protein [Methylovorus menthalis]|uniref:EAL domain-containing protein n=1 Tax=Methylovorus menthalis TaxID=1002227 RepID=UPI001E58F625|nr:EAL domain-containing protein [Methylovorus menthalis]MCB4809731.1 EAL domain-containing protein [Methylovorus menthalis]